MPNAHSSSPASRNLAERRPRNIDHSYVPMKPCGLFREYDRCQRLAIHIWPAPTGELRVCDIHYRILKFGEFGQRYNPPWTKEQALEALVKQDGLDVETAKRRVNEWFEDCSRGAQF
jgi:hypothetical protein